MFITTLLVTFCAAAPSSPKEIVFPEYVFTPPVSEEFREFILDGIPVFIAEDQELPLINLVPSDSGEIRKIVSHTCSGTCRDTRPRHSRLGDGPPCGVYCRCANNEHRDK